MPINNVLASVAVKDVNSAATWYAKLFGREADGHADRPGRKPSGVRAGGGCIAGSMTSRTMTDRSVRHSFITSQQEL
jgi:hypothetical protein